MTNVYQYGDRDAAIVTAQRVATAIDLRLSRMVALDDKIAAEYQAAQSGLTYETGLTDPSLVIVAGYLQSAIRQPSLTAGILDERFEAFSSLIDDLLIILDGVEVSGYGRWQARTIELSLSAILTSLSRVVTTSTPDSRAHAITVAGRILDELWDIVDALDTTAARFDLQDWDARYFSQSRSYTIAAHLVAEAVRYLLRSAYDLQVEKRFTLRSPTAPVVLAIEQYPNQEIERALDLLCKANAIYGDEILVLPSGREIVVYV
jgi:hypothetical protein